MLFLQNQFKDLSIFTHTLLKHLFSIKAYVVYITSRHSYIESMVTHISFDCPLLAFLWSPTFSADIRSPSKGNSCGMICRPTQQITNPGPPSSLDLKGYWSVSLMDVFLQGCRNEDFTSQSNKEKMNWVFYRKLSQDVHINKIISINNIRDQYVCSPKGAYFINMSFDHNAHTQFARCYLFFKIGL